MKQFLSVVQKDGFGFYKSENPFTDSLKAAIDAAVREKVDLTPVEGQIELQAERGFWRHPRRTVPAAFSVGFEVRSTYRTTEGLTVEVFVYHHLGDYKPDKGWRVVSKPPNSRNEELDLAVQAFPLTRQQAAFLGVPTQSLKDSTVWWASGLDLEVLRLALAGLFCPAE